MTEKEVRSLIDREVPYKDMTEEEIEAVIEWKVNVATQSKLYQDIIDMNIKKYEQLAEKNNTKIEEMKEYYSKVKSDIINKRVNRREQMRTPEVLTNE